MTNAPRARRPSRCVSGVRIRTRWKPRKAGRSGNPQPGGIAHKNRRSDCEACRYLEAGQIFREFSADKDLNSLPKIGSCLHRNDLEINQILAMRQSKGPATPDPVLPCPENTGHLAKPSNWRDR